MMIEIKSILSEIGKVESHRLEEVLVETIIEDGRITSPVYIDLKMTNTGIGILVQGHLKVKVELTCAVCLKAFETDLEFDFEERFIEDQPDPFQHEIEHEIEEADIYYTYDPEKGIDLHNLVRELIILNLPIAMKCDINCRVVDREENEKIDPRFKILEKLKSEEPDGSTQEKDDQSEA